MPETLVPEGVRAPRAGITLVTGASGFLGRHVCMRLAGRGLPVRALVRRDAPGLEHIERQATSDLGDRAALRVALDGVDTVIHLAGYAHVPRRRQAQSELRRANVEGTAALVEEAGRAGVRTFVFASSVKAVGEATAPGEPWNESVSPAPQDPYGASKLEAERLLAVAAAAHGLWAPVLRLPLVYGPGMRANMLRLFQLVDSGVPLPLKGIENCRSFIYVGNVTAAIDAVLSGPAGMSDPFFASDDRDLSTLELLTLIADALGRRPRLFRVPAPLLTAAARAGDVMSRVLPAPLDTPALDRLRGSLALDITRIRMRGYVPAFTVEQGMAHTAAWFRTRERS